MALFEPVKGRCEEDCQPQFSQTMSLRALITHVKANRRDGVEAKHLINADIATEDNFKVCSEGVVGGSVEFPSKRDEFVILGRNQSNFCSDNKLATRHLSQIVACSTGSHMISISIESRQLAYNHASQRSSLICPSRKADQYNLVTGCEVVDDELVSLDDVLAEIFGRRFVSVTRLA